MRAVVLVMIAAGCTRHDPPPAPVASPAPVPVHARAAPVVATAVPLPPPPRSLEGTEVDGAFTRVDGRLVLDAPARRALDYFLTASGEEPDETIRARVAGFARDQGVDPDDALALFDRYLAYRADGAERFSHPLAPGLDPASALRALQRDHFGDDAPAFFAP
jgi:lipase chaperone LimK